MDDDDSDAWSYRGTPARPKMLLAPMVRTNSLAFRTLCSEYGANMVYSEELVDKCIMESRREVNEALGTIDYVSSADRGGGRVVFRTYPNERVVLQLGTASGPTALLAAQHVGADVRAIDVNMGCPVKFSTQGGMGSALLSDPERACEILTTLRRNLPASIPVTCKIRLLDSLQETLTLARAIESCGVAALAVHARRRHDRPRHWAQWDQFRLLRDALPPSLPLVLNGDVFTQADVPRALSVSGADALMLARGALWNASLFGAVRGKSSCSGGKCGRGDDSDDGGNGGDGRDASHSDATRVPSLAPPSEVLRRYFELGAQTACPVGNLKYTAMLMLEGAGRLEAFKLVQRAKSLDDLHAAAAAAARDPHLATADLARCPAVLEPPPDLPDAHTLSCNAWRPLPVWWKPHAANGQPMAAPRHGKGRYKAAKERAPPVAASHRAQAPLAAEADAGDSRDPPVDESADRHTRPSTSPTSVPSAKRTRDDEVEKEQVDMVSA